MTRETKVGLLVGMGVILLIGIIISDHLSVVQQQDPAEQMTQFAQRAQESISSSADPEPADAGRRSASTATTSTQHAASETIRASETNRTSRTSGASSVLQRMQMVPTPQELDDPRWQADASQTAQSSPQPIDTAAQSDPGRDDLPRAYRVDQPEPRSAGRTAAPASDRSNNVPRLTLSHAPDSSAPAMSLEDESVLRTPAPEPAQIRRASVPTLPDPAASSAAVGPGSEIIHYVQPGETLYEIAQKYYGNGEYWRTIAAHNKQRVKANGQVNQNVRLVVPNRAGLAALGDDFIPAGRELVRRVAPQRPPEPPKTIEVEAGDTLTELASRHLGSATRWQELLDANKDQLDRPEHLRAGMTLKLPQQEDESSRAAAPAVAPSPLRVVATQSGRLERPQPQSQTQTRTAPSSSRQPSHTKYVVKSGDSLYRIAAETLGDGTRWREVYDANRDKLSNPDAVVVGQTLKIPAD